MLRNTLENTFPAVNFNSDHRFMSVSVSLNFDSVLLATHSGVIWAERLLFTAEKNKSISQFAGCETVIINSFLK